MTKQELEAENEELRDALAEAREHLWKLDTLLGQTLDEEDQEEDEEE